jgi:hypothetical protein
MGNPKVCAICGYGRATTRDHLPPRGIFPRPLPVRMVTVPACSDCNNGASDQDDRFRLYLAASTAYFNDAATRLWRERVLPTLHANGRLRREFSTNFGDGIHQRADGTIDRREGFRWPISAYSPVLERIARGLYYHHFDECLGRRAQCEIHMVSALPDKFVEQTNDWPTDHVGNEIFTYRYGRAEEAPLRSYWVFQFFKAHWGTVETFPVGEPPMIDLAE